MRGRFEARQRGKRRQRVEEAHCIAFADWARLVVAKFPALALLHHIPNGGLRSVSEAVRFKRVGVLAGLPDYHLPVARRGYVGLWIEFKAPGEKSTDLQLAVQKALIAEKNFVAEFDDWQRASELVIWYLIDEV